MSKYYFRVLFGALFCMLLLLCRQASAQVDSLISLAAAERKMGAYERALHYDLQALNFARKTADKELEAAALNGIATDYYRNNDLEKARQYYEESLSLYTLLGDSINMADQLYKLGMIDVDEGSNVEAGRHFRNARVIFEKKQNYAGLADLYNGYASLFYTQQNLDSVSWYAFRSLDYYRLAGNADAESFMYINLGALENARGNHQKALELVLQGIDVAEQEGLLNQLRQGYKNLSETYAMLGNWKAAYENQLKYIGYKDSLFNEQKDKALKELETKYQTSEKELRIQEQEADILRKEREIEGITNLRNVLILFIAIILILVLFFFYRYRSRQRYTLLLDEKNRQLSEINAFKDKMFAVISHDLRSPVSSFSRLTETLSMAIDHISAEDLRRYLDELNRSASELHQMLRGLLSWSLSQQGGLHADVKAQVLYPLIERTVHECRAASEVKGIVVRILSDANIMAKCDEGLLQISLRNVLSNAIRFTPEGHNIDVSVTQFENEIAIDVRDEGSGVKNDIVESLFTSAGISGDKKGSGFGLFITRELLHAMGGTIELASTSEKGSVFRIILPLP